MTHHHDCKSCNSDTPDHHDHHHQGHDHHGHHHSSDKKTFHVHVHDGATVASGVFTVPLKYQAVVVYMQNQLKLIAEWVDAEGGIIGHIKAYLKRSDANTLMSITDCDEEVSVKKNERESVEISFTAIVYAIKPDVLDSRLSEMIHAIEKL